MSINKWSKEDLMSLYKERNENKLDFPEIAKKLKKTVNSISIQYKRVDWELFLDNPDEYMSNKGSKKWDQIEMAKLYAFIKSGKSYKEIAKELGRSYISVERKAQTTDWQAWQTVVGDASSPKDIEESKDTGIIEEKLSNALIQLCRSDKERLNSISEEEFLRKINIEDENIPVSFKKIKELASQYLDSLGYGNPEEIKLGEGSYIIMSDSHGKWTKTEMFNLLNNLNTYIKPNKIIHIGHILDDDNEISYNMGEFKNLIILAKDEELRTVQAQRNTYNFNYEIVKGDILLGKDLSVTNQEIISDYVRSPLSTLDSHVFDEKLIVNNHRLEWSQKCSEGNNTSYIVSPGCVCEKHVLKTIKQIDFEDNRIVKQSYNEGFSKYRKMKKLCDYWNQGVLVVHIDSKGFHTIIPCLIRNFGKKEYITSYFDKIITNNGIKEPDKKIFISADMHSPNQDNNVLDIQSQICKDYKPDIFVNIGDSHDYRSLNHHEMERGVTITQDILDESAQVHHALKKMSEWAKEKHIIYGNHERFSADFIAKFPQFKKYLDFRFICDIEGLGYKMTNLKDILKIGSSKFIHGDLTMYGQSGTKLEKAARTFKGTVFIGHMHYPAIRFGSYSIGLSGKLDQVYNEPSASTWIHGFGMCNHYKKHSYPTTIAIVDNTCIINNKCYKPINPKSWKLNKYRARLVYEGV